jgi:formiminotetrahydrofolate cyclodeaminase
VGVDADDDEFYDEYGFEDWLDKLASGSSTPGGGAVAALNAAMAGSLICMVCHLTIGKPKYAAFEEQITSALHAAQIARRTAFNLIYEDEVAFDKVMEAYRLPRETDDEKAHRENMIDVASISAAIVPLRVAHIAAEIIGLAEQIREGANINVLSDVAVAAANARAALESSLVNVAINLRSVRHEKAYTPLKEKADEVEPALERADAVVRAIRERFAG